MMVKAMAISRQETASKILNSLAPLSDARLDFPHLRPGAFFAQGTYPAAKWQVKLYAVLLHPGREVTGDPWYSPWSLAARAARTLEARRGLALDWAAGARRNGLVWLLVKPYAVDEKTGKRVWFRPSPDDLAALRKLVPSRPKERGASGGRSAERRRQR